MNSFQRPVSLNETSFNANKLHKLLAASGNPVNKKEVESYHAGEDTLAKVRAFQKEAKINIDENVLADPKTMEALQKKADDLHRTDASVFTLSGTVFNRNGKPVRKQHLLVLDMDLKGAAIYLTALKLSEIIKSSGFEFLGEVYSGVNGFYSLRFSSWQYSKAERKKADIVVYALEGEKIVGRTNRINAENYGATGEVRDVDVYIIEKDDRTEYENVMKSLLPFLQESQVALAALSVSTDQLEFASQELDLEAQKIRIAAQAESILGGFRKKQEALHELLYGLGRKGCNLSWMALYKKSKDELVSLIHEAENENIIRKFTEDELNQLVKLVFEQSVKGLLNYKGANQPVTLKKMLSVALAKEEDQETFLSAFTRFQSENPTTSDYRKFWVDYLPSQPAFRDNPQLVNDLLHLQKLAVLTGHHFPIIEELQMNRKVDSVQKLLELDSNAWKEIIDKTGAPDYMEGNDQEEKKRNFQHHIEAVLHATYPTQKIASMLKNGELSFDDGHVAHGVTTFLNSTQKFDISSSRIQDFDKEIKEVTGEQYQQVKNELKKLQRIYQVSPTPKAMGVLLDNKLHSAYSITSIPRKTFIKNYSGDLGGTGIAEALYERAGYVHSLAAERTMKMYDVSHSASPEYAYSEADYKEAVKVIEKHVPNYSELFGSPDICECEHCRSVYSAAAYFVDLLRFLWRGQTNANGETPLEMFAKRRPDLLHLPLTCENTNTLIPYIDLVNEIMEYYTYHGFLDKNAVHDTGDSNADELRASPQFIELEAYRNLKNAVFPFSLPYHQPLDIIRTYGNHLQTDRYQLMKAMQKDFSPAAEVAIQAESLQLSQEEYAVLTGKKFDGTNDTKQLHEYFGYTNAADLEKMSGTGVSDGIHEFLRRSGMKYTDLVELVKTRFINPDQDNLDFLEQLFLNSSINPSNLYSKLRQINDGTLLPSADTDIMLALNAANITSAQFVTWIQSHFQDINKIITLYQSDSLCELDSTFLRTIENIYSGIASSGITPPVWQNIHQYIRLCRKLRWKIPEVDNILSALDEITMTPQTITKLSWVVQLNKELKKPINQLATFWGNIDTYGEKSLYKKLFLNKAVQQLDTAFKADAFGNYLTDTGKVLADHVPAILAAFRMSQEDLDAILKVATVQDNGNPRPLNLVTDVLNLANLSIIYRYVLFSKALKYKVPDFCLLIQLFNAKIFSVWDIQQKKFLAIDPEKTFRFYETATAIKKSGFKPVVLDYIFTGNLPPESSLALNEEKILTAARAIRIMFNTLEQDYPDAPQGELTADRLKAILALSFAQPVVNDLIGILESRQSFNIITESGLAPTIPAALAGKYVYDPASGTLSVTGMMTEAERTALASMAGVTDSLKAALDQLSILSNTIPPGTPVYSTTTDTNLGITIPEHLASKFTYIKASGRLLANGVMFGTEQTDLKNLPGSNANFKAAVDLLYDMPQKFLAENFGGVFTILADANKILLNRPAQPLESTPPEKREWVYNKYIPVLKNKLRQDAITQHLAALIGLSEEMTAILMKNDVPFLVEALSKSGFSASYYSDATWSTSVLDRLDESIDFDWGSLSPDSDQAVSVIPNDNFSVRWKTFLSPPSSGEYTFQVDVKEQDELFKLYLDDALILEKNAVNINTELQTLAQLNASRLHQIVVEYAEKMGNSGISLSWKTATSAMQTVDSGAAFPYKEIKQLIATVGVYHRAAKFISGFKITSPELNHFIQFSADFDNIDFKALTNQHWMRINDYADLRNVVPQQQATIVDVFLAANVSSPAPAIASLNSLLALATAWDEHTVTFLANEFTLAVADYKNEKAFKKLQKAIRFVQKTGIGVEAISKWAVPETDFDKLHSTAETVKTTVKAKYEEEDWLKLAGQLSDTIREHQKQALISYLLTKPELKAWGVTDADGLFEYFLIDVQMGACMDTSRIVQANAAVQMFVNRCFLNLESDLTSGSEKGISPEALDKDRWEWMKYYRVWEVNRKIFLYPENWLEPEWRDDRSPFFKALESELIQNDITPRTVETAFRNYLNNLNSVANLQVCATLPEKDDRGNLKLFHVFGRTHNIPYQFYYRTWNKYMKWSAWEKIQVDIRSVERGESSGVHTIPVLWKGRLFVFWPEFVEKQENVRVKEGSNDANFEQIAKKSPQATTPKNYWNVHLAWSEYIDGKWTSKQVSKEYIKQEHWDYIPDESAIRFATEVDKDQVLTIYLVINYGDPDQAKRDWYLDGAFELTDITSKVNSNSGSYGHAHEKMEPEYITSYMAVRTYGMLQLKNNTFLQANVNHKLVLSPEITDFDPEYRNPFFYHDIVRSYFIRPTAVWIRDVIIEPERYIPSLIGYVDDSYWSEIHPRGPIVEQPGFGYTDPLPDPFLHPGGFGLSTQPVRAIRSSRIMSEAAAPVMAARSAVTTNGVMNVNTMSINTSKDIAFYDLAFAGAYEHNKVGWWWKWGLKLEFHTFYHPYSNHYITRLNQKGMKGLMESDTALPSDSGTVFTTNYKPNFNNNAVYKAPATDEYKPAQAYTYYKENVCFDVFGANSIYNWELFYHAPLYIATRLSKNGKYEEAMKWFHYIFDPTTDELPAAGQSATSRYWKVLPFKTTPAENLEEWFMNLGANNNPSSENSVIGEWRDNPFKPFVVARNRPLAFMKNVVIKYVENLLDWADSLFRMFTRETVYESLQLYVIASHVLGSRPEFVPKRGKIRAETYDSLKAKWDDFSNALVELENLFPYSSTVPSSSSTSTTSLLGVGKALYFCIPNNEKLLEHWDRVADRLFKIRHCMDIDGVERRLALFAPPIDPAMLINAAAQGLSLGSILSDLSSPPPIYRFSYLIQRAYDFCGEVRGLGNALLTALEKKDGEELSRLRATHETAMLEQVTAIKERQVLEARSNRDALLKSRELAGFRLQHYNSLLSTESITIPSPPTLESSLEADSQLPETSINEIVSDADAALVESGESGVKIIPKEKEDLDKSEIAKWVTSGAGLAEAAAAVLRLIPQGEVDGKPLGVGAGFGFGGVQLGGIASGLAGAAHAFGSFLSMEAAAAAKMATYIRREQEWTLQANLAAKEIIQLDKQLTSAEIRIQIARKELDNHLIQIENSKQVEQYLQDKFTNQELYQWMKEQLFAVYKQSYNMAFDMAKKVEKCYRYEMGNEVTDFIQYGYWDNIRQGLGAGEKLQMALRQLEKSYLEENKRELELTKNISVALINPLALQELKTTGKCFITLPEELFDLDYPGHYFRRIKSVRVSLPCIAGPFTTVNCTLRLLRNTIRINTTMNDDGNYEHNNDEGIWIDDDRFRENNVPVRAIATSTAQLDPGLFELNFRDERYLPFEGAGLVSEWKVELNADPELRQFDFSTIADVVLHIGYTAREDAGLFRQQAVAHLKDFLTNAAELSVQPLMRMFNIRHEFSTEWYKFLHPAVAGADQVLTLALRSEHFPFFTKNRSIDVKKINVLLSTNRSGDYKMIITGVDESGGAMNSTEINMPESASLGNMQKATITATTASFNAEDLDILKPVTLKVKHNSDADYKSIDTDPEEIVNMFIIVHYALGD